MSDQTRIPLVITVCPVAAAFTAISACSTSESTSSQSLAEFVESVGWSNYREDVDFAPFVKEWG